MVRALLVRGMSAGLLAGVLGFAFAWLVGEPFVNQAIAFESYIDYTVRHERPEMDLVSRQLQSTAGLATGALIFGVAMGGLFAIVFAVAYGRIGPLSARATSAVLGLLAFASVYFMPLLKYPPNPPSIGNPDTIDQRTELYVAMLLVSVVGMILVVLLRASLAHRLGGWNATLLAGAVYIVFIGLSYAVLPGINEVPQQALPNAIAAVTDDGVTFPPTVLWGFRVASLGLQVVVWTTITLTFGWLAERKINGAERDRAGRTAAAR